MRKRPLLREIIPGAQMELMLTKTMTYAETCDPDEVLMAQKPTDNHFYADVQIAGISKTHVHWLKTASDR